MTAIDHSSNEETQSDHTLGINSLHRSAFVN